VIFAIDLLEVGTAYMAALNNPILLKSIAMAAAGNSERGQIIARAPPGGGGGRLEAWRCLKIICHTLSLSTLYYSSHPSPTPTDLKTRGEGECDC
jgi:hypothetical protein